MMIRKIRHAFLSVFLSIAMVVSMTPLAWADVSDTELGTKLPDATSSAVENGTDEVAPPIGAVVGAPPSVSNADPVAHPAYADGVVGLPSDNLASNGASDAELANVSGNWSYTVDDDKATITGYSGAEADVAIPTAIDGYAVVSIGYRAFYGCTSLASITFAEGSQIASIGSCAFSGCTSLASITIPASVTSIRNAAFEGCTSLQSIGVDAANAEYASVGGVLCSKDGSTLVCCPEGKVEAAIPASVTSIGSSAFCGCASLESIEIPASVTSIGSSAFSGCTSLASIAFVEGSQLSSIGSYAFSRCASLASFTIPASVTSIGNNAFERCTSLQSIGVDAANAEYTSVGGVLCSKDGSTLVCCPAGKAEAAIPASVTSIGNFAFYGCASLAAIAIPASVTSIGSSAFAGCTSLASVIFAEGSQLSTIGVFAFSSCTSLAIIAIPASVTSIESDAFPGCTSLASVIFAEGSQLASIGAFAFSECTSLATIVIPASVTSIGNLAFYNCASLAAIRFAGNAPTIDGEAFSKVTATAYYPQGDATWTESVRQSYGGAITWEAYQPPIPISYAEVADIPDQTFTGAAIEPVLAVTYAGATLEEGADYTVAYSRNIAVGTATATVTGIGGYTGTVETTFNIVAPQGCAALRGDANGSGAVNIVDAQIALDLSNGVYGASYDSFPYPAEWGDTRVLWLRIAADANADGAIDSLDARAIQVYAHRGEWG